MKTQAFMAASDTFMLYIAIGAALAFIILVIQISIVYAILKSSSELTTIRKILEAREQKENSQKELVV